MPSSGNGPREGQRNKMVSTLKSFSWLPLWKL